VHFYSIFLRKTGSNKGSPEGSAPEREHARAAKSPARRTAPARHRTTARAPRRSASPEAAHPAEAGTHAKAPRDSALPAPRPEAGTRRQDALACLPAAVLSPARATSLRFSLTQVVELLYKVAAAPPVARRTTQQPTVPSADAKTEQLRQAPVRPTTSQSEPSSTLLCPCPCSPSHPRP
jgi:hypothetical protein